MTIATATQYCENLVREGDRDRWLLSLFAPMQMRQALYSINAFYLELARNADAVSQPMLGEIRLQWWRDTLDGLFLGNPRHMPLAEALAVSIASYQLSRDLFDRIVEARTRDLYPDPPEDLAALEDYLSSTSGALNQLSLAVLGVRNSTSILVGEKIGIAYGLLGHIRAIEFHAQAGRIFIPKQLLEHEGLTADDVRQNNVEEALAQIRKVLAKRAYDLLKEARQANISFDPQMRPILFMARLSDIYLKNLQKRKFSAESKNLAPSNFIKQWSLLWGALTKNW